MPKPNPQDDVIEYRREVVGKFRKMGYSCREIARLLPLQDPPVLNPNNEPYTYAAVYNDIVHLREEWKRDAAADFAGHQADQIEQIKLAQHEAWKRGDLGTVLNASDRLARIMGMNAPERVEQTGTHSLTVEFVHTGQQETPAEEGGDD